MPIHLPVILAGFLAVAAPGQSLDLTPRDQMQSEQAPSDMLGQQDDQAQDDQDDQGLGGGGAKAQLTDTELFSALAGNIVGAATVCSDIAKERVTHATDQIATLVSTTSADQDEQALSKLLFLHNVGGGRQAVRSGEVDCGTVDASLTKLDQFAQRAAASSNTGGSE